MIINSLLLAGSVIFSNLPIGDGSVDWGSTVVEIKQKIKVEKVSGEAGHGHGFSDFTESDPLVYVNNASPEKKVEYYFYNEKLYKVYSIYRTQNDVDAFYKAKIEELTAKLGEPTKSFTDELFSMPIQHHVWESDVESLDLRLGAGYVYEVRTEKNMALDKSRKSDLKHAI